MDKPSAPFLDGWQAHKNHGVSVSNPHADRNKRYSYNQWEKGWTARLNAVKHDLPLEYDHLDGME